MRPLSTNAGDHDLLPRTLSGDRVALARAISRVENEAPELGRDARRLLRAQRPRVPDRHHRTAGRRQEHAGARGSRRSTARRGETVAIVAVDPTSPFSGGALLGDRVRMGELSGDPGVFIRSMATRGSMGGLAVHTAQACDVLDAAGFTRILIETVGVGQSELEVAQTADTTAVVLVPESGDAVQAMKAGLMEIGDLFVINKADREGAERAAFAIRSALELRAVPAELAVAGAAHRGVAGRPASPRSWTDFEEHLEYLKSEGGLDRRRRQRLEQRLEDLLRDRLWGAFRDARARRRVARGAGRAGRAPPDAAPGGRPAAAAAGASRCGRRMAANRSEGGTGP